MAKNYEYKKATIADIDELVRTRIIVLRTANKLSNDVDMSLVEKESYEYYKNALETGEHIAYWCMITKPLLALVVSVFIGLCRHIIIQQVKRLIL